MTDPEVNSLEEIERKIEAGDITHADIYTLIEQLRKLIEEIERLRNRLAKEEYNRKFGM